MTALICADMMFIYHISILLYLIIISLFVHTCTVMYVLCTAVCMYIYVCMYVSMYVCMYACMYACMYIYVCMYVSM